MSVLPVILRGPCRFNFRSEEWEAYLARIGQYAHWVDHQFLRQVPYDHYDHFNAHYPWFDIDRAGFERTSLTAADIYEKIRYFDGKPLDFWYAQFDEFLKNPQDYEIFAAIVDNLTWPFPPIILRGAGVSGVDQPLGLLGQPFHLIEGTHRVSYLCRMLELRMLEPTSLHDLIVVTPNSTVDQTRTRAARAGYRGR